MGLLEKLKNWALLPHPHSLIEELNPFGDKSQRWRAIRFWVVLGVMLWLGNVLAHLWVFEYAGLWSGDALLRMRPPKDATSTGVVIVTAEDRLKRLGGVSPIPKDDMLRAVCAVLRVHPKQLGVDLSTAEVPIEKLPKQPVIWARGVKILREGKSLRVEQDSVLGGKHPEARHGLAVAPVKPDWSAREIPLCYEYDEGRVMRTMVGALTKVTTSNIGEECRKEDHEEASSYDVNYQFERFTLADFAPEKLNATDLQQCINGVGDWDPKSPSAETSAHPLKGRVVLLGGEYDPQDWHPTPYGLRPGVEVLAGFSEYVLQGLHGGHLESWQKWGLKLILAFIIAWIHCRFRPVAALLLCLFGLGILVVSGGVIAAYVAGYRAATIPFLLGIILEQLVTSAAKGQEGVGNAVHPTVGHNPDGSVGRAGVAGAAAIEPAGGSAL